MIKEVCIENFTNVPELIKKGADRFELNTDLAAGGLTPSFGVIKKTVEYSHKYNVPVMTMIRPRSGNFVYNKAEINIMMSDIQMVSLLGGDGVVFGCLTQENQLDKSNLKKLIKLSKSLGLTVVMHMAFDEINPEEKKEAIDWLSKQKVDRILTHGGSLKKSIEETYSQLKDTIAYAQGKIEILPGGGITSQNLDNVDKHLQNNQYHGSRII